VEQRLGSVDASVICLQEVWSENHAKSFTRALERRGYFVLQGPRRSSAPGTGCSARELSRVAACLSAQCRGAPDQALCALRKCASVGDALTPSCSACLASNPDLSQAAVTERCQATQGSSSVYEGATGLILASSHPITKQHSMLLPSGPVSQGVLFARITDRKLDVYCTHLTARPQHTTLDRWREMSSRQIKSLLDYVAGNSSGSASAILGDLNLTSGSSAFIPFKQAGFVSEYVVKDGRCTHCAGKGAVIDHVLTRRPVEVLKANRVFDDAELSDHLGVLLHARVPLAKL
jgi:endonuclease/exonuclease/phosphatase family metal-dependent hydrolase